MEIAQALGIAEVLQTEVDGFEGMLLTDRRRSQGRIIANTRRGPQAARFTIAHEIGHFLLERHQLGKDGTFACQLGDMQQFQRSPRPNRQEIEANTFAIGLLAPPDILGPFMTQVPDIDVINRLKLRLNLSREAAARCLIEAHDEPLAAVWAKDGVIRYVFRGARFPWVRWAKGDRLPPLSHTYRFVQAGHRGVSTMREIAPPAWVDAAVEDLFEQVLIGAEGHSMTLLLSSLPTGPDED